MPRAPSYADVFNAVAMRQRRTILELLREREHSVSVLVQALRVSQPSISKHLGVLRKARLVRTRRDGRQVLYRTNAGAIKPLYEWAGMFERFWSDRRAAVKGKRRIG